MQCTKRTTSGRDVDTRSWLAVRALLARIPLGPRPSLKDRVVALPLPAVLVVGPPQIGARIAEGTPSAIGASSSSVPTFDWLANTMSASLRLQLQDTRLERSYLPLRSPKILVIAVVGRVVVRYVNHLVCHPLKLKLFGRRVLSCELEMPS
jgi:hypothetical protein